MKIMELSHRFREINAVGTKFKMYKHDESFVRSHRFREINAVGTIVSGKVQDGR